MLRAISDGQSYGLFRGDALIAWVNVTGEGHVDGPGRWWVNPHTASGRPSRNTHETARAAVLAKGIRVDAWQFADGSENSCGVLGCTNKGSHRRHKILPTTATDNDAPD